MKLYRNAKCLFYLHNRYSFSMTTNWSGLNFRFYESEHQPYGVDWL